MPTQNIYDLVDTWNAGATTFTAVKMNVTDTASAANSLLMDLQIGGSSRFNVEKAGSLKLGVSPTGTNQAGTDVIIAGSQGTGSGAGGALIFQVAQAGGGGTAQNALGTVFKINQTGTLTLGSFQYSGLSFGSGGEFNVERLGTITIKAASTGVYIPPAAQFGWASSALPVGGTGTIDIILARDAVGVLGVRGSSATTPAAMSFYTYGASPPAAPAASIVRLYADTSGGKIRLMAIFPSGVAQQIAIEP